MAIGISTAFTIRDELFSAGYVEKLTQKVNIFNEGTKGAIRLQTESMAGHYNKTRFFDRQTGTNSRRDTTSVAAQTDTNMTQDELVGVKRDRKYAPRAMTLDSWLKAGISDNQMAVMAGQNMADESLKDYVEAVVISLKAALTDNSGAANTDYSATGVLSHAALIDALTLFGDASNDIVCWFGHSKSAFDLLDASLTVSSGHVGPAAIYEEGVGTFRRPYVVTDSSNFIITGTPNDYVTFGLVENACVVTISETPRFVGDLVTGLENLVMRFQGEYSYNIDVLGHSYDVSVGANPTDANLGATGTWDIEVASIKNGPGVFVRTQ